MYYQKRGPNKYSFIYWDASLKKNVRLPANQVPLILSDKEADNFCRIWDAKFDATKSRILKKLSWESKYHDFKVLIDYFEIARKEAAPNCWQTDLILLRYYVLPFFLEIKHLNNINLWPNEFESFRDYLLVAEPVKKAGGSPLSYSSKNNIIKTLNAFMLATYRRRLVERLEKCRYFSKSKVRRKNEDSVISSARADEIFNAINEINPGVASFFWILLNTGLRLNECLGLSLADVIASNIFPRTLEEALAPYKLKAIGQLTIDSQPRNLIRVGISVERKPLKGRKAITHGDARIIPIFDEKTFRHLIGLWNHQQFLYKMKRFGSDPKNYLLFDGLNKNKISQVFRTAQAKLKYSKFYTPHDCRHTYSTWLAGQTGGNYTLCRLILGHQDLSMTLSYTHLSAQLHKDAVLHTRLEEPMELPLPIVPNGE